MKRFIYTALAIVFLICIVILASLFFWIKQDVLNNIELAEQKYHAHGEKALISFLEDERNSYYDRTHLAVWTLGKIRSQRALAVLKKYYINDPKGRSCKGMHHEKICQYELYKAIKAIENGTLLSYASLK
jgi:hypothetical protein